MYKTGASLTLPTYLSAPTDYSVWNGTADITATTGHDLVIVEVNATIRLSGGQGYGC